MIDFFGPGFEASDAMGLLPRLRQLACPVDELNYVDRIAYLLRHIDCASCHGNRRTRRRDIWSAERPSSVRTRTRYRA